MILVQATENVHLQNSSSDMENISSGWVVLRSCTEFHVSFLTIIFIEKINLTQSSIILQDLNRKLRQLCGELKSLDLPSSTFKMFFLKNDKNSLERAKGEVQKFLNVSV